VGAWKSTTGCEPHCSHVAAARSEKKRCSLPLPRGPNAGGNFSSKRRSNRVVSNCPFSIPPARPETAFAAHKEGLLVFLSEAPDAKSLREVLRNQQRRRGSCYRPSGWTDMELAAPAPRNLKTPPGKLILRTETAVVASLAL